MTKKSGSKAKKVIVTILVVLVALVAIVLIGARIYFRAPVSAYYKASEKAFVIPGLLDNMTPQGLDYVSSVDTYLICGYQKDGSPSRIYRVDGASGKDDGYVVMGDENGNGIKPHAGGLASHGEYLFVAGDEDACINVYSLNDVLSAKSGDVVKKLGSFSTKFLDDKINVAWICFSDDCMIVGEFYRDPNYMTNESHWIKTTTGEENRAIAWAYKFSNGEDSAFGISTSPFEMYSMPGLVQGMTVRDGKIWISQSYGTAKSTIRSYDVSGSEPVKFVDKDDIHIPVYAFDSSTQTAYFEAAPMAEEIVFVNGKLLIMSESASMKYIFGNFTGGRYCYATDIDKFS
ncbi:MAG: hypothetical protein IKT10_04465 [Clostridiales bacterium]|nr:hypothetical protein [Clostridiales bacterium]